MDARLSVDGTVESLELVLNGAFYLDDNQIYIESGEERNRDFWYFESEGQQCFCAYMEKENNGITIPYYGEGTYGENFILHVPSFLCSSAVETEDSYGGIHLRTIKNILKTYKPAGRSYRIEIYDYE